MTDDATLGGRLAAAAERPPPELPSPSTLDEAVAMAVVGVDGSVTAATRRWSEVTGWSDEAVVGRQWSEVAQPATFPPRAVAGSAEGAAADGSAASGASARWGPQGAPTVGYPLRVLAPDGQPVQMLAQVSEVRATESGSAEGWLVVGVCPSAGATPGADAPGATPVATSAAADSDLVASVSHELRTPLTSIVSFTQLLRDGLGTDQPSEQREYLDIIERNSDRLLRLVDDLLLLDRLEAAHLTLDCEAVDVPTLAEVAVSSMRPLAEEKGIALELQTSDGPSLLADVDRLGQLIDNLLANAVKFTPSRGSVRVRAEPVAGGWRLVVADTGIGIPDEEQDKLFRRFYRASNARNDGMSGSGLGLVIARRIAELHRGTISVASKVGRGTVATVELSGVPEGASGVRDGDGPAR